MARVFKYPIVVTGRQQISIPPGAQFLHVAQQAPSDRHLCIWALVDDLARPYWREIRMVGTGHPFDDAAEFPVFVGSALMNGGSLVFHVFAAADA